MKRNQQYEQTPFTGNAVQVHITLTFEFQKTVLGNKNVIKFVSRKDNRKSTRYCWTLTFYRRN
jgi:hypothetical protein